MSHPSPKLIAVDNNQEVLQAIAAIASPQFEVMKTSDLRRALQWLETEKEIAVVVAELLLPGASGLELLMKAQQVQPAARRVLLTSFSELTPIIEGIHSGAIQLFVQKPLRAAELASAIGRRAA